MKIKDQDMDSYGNGNCWPIEIVQIVFQVTIPISTSQKRRGNVQLWIPDARQPSTNCSFGPQQKL